MHAAHSAYRPEIDGLRAVAVVPVILFHAGIPGFSGGFVGVDVFFVISGYLITGILLNDLAQGRFSLARFYERRARRILPALVVVLAVCLPFAWVWMLPAAFADFAKALIAVSLFVSNILFWRQSDYFAPEAELNPLLHTWSLAVEEQFYILFPLLLWALWRTGRAGQTGRIVLVLGTLALASLMLAELGWRWRAVANFYLLPTRAWELLAGALIAVWHHAHGRQPRPALALLGLVLVLGAVMVFGPETPVPSVWMLVPVGGTALILAFGGTLDSKPLARAGLAGAGLAGAANRLLGWRPLVGLGLVSYSAYLWHQPLFAFARIRSLEHPSLAVMLTLAVLALMLAALTWRFVEQPFRARYGETAPILPHARQVFAAWAGVTLVGCVLGAGGIATQGAAFRLDMPEPLRASLYDRNAEAACFNQPAPCRFGASTDGHVLVLGDSHAIALAPPLAQALAQAGLALHVWAVAGCVPLLDTFVQRNDDLRVLCGTRNATLLPEGPLPRAVVLVARWSIYNHPDRGPSQRYLDTQPQVSPDVTRTREVFARQLDTTLAYFAARDIPVIVLHQPAFQQHKAPDLYARLLLYGADNSYLQRHATPRAIWDSLYAPTRERITSAVAQVAQTRVLDPADLLCAGPICAMGTPDLSWYLDDNHLSEAGSRRVASALAEGILATR